MEETHPAPSFQDPSSPGVSEVPSSTPSPQPAASSAVEMYMNLYHLHHSDSTNLIIVSDLLTESNYNSWSRAMLIGLLCKNKVGFVGGSLPCPSGDLRSS